VQKKCLHQDTWKLLDEKRAVAEAKKALKKQEAAIRRQRKDTKRKSSANAPKTVLPTSTEVKKEVTPAPEEGDSIVVRTPEELERARTAAVTLNNKAVEALKQTVMKTPISSGKEHTGPMNEIDLSLDTSILEEAPQYAASSRTTTPVADLSIMAPPMDIYDTSPKTPKTMHPPMVVSPSSLKNVKDDIQREYIAALQKRPAATKAKVTYTSSTKSIKRKADEESPDRVPPKNKKVEVDAVADDQTTFENLRQLSFGLRVRGS
jgi:hypothetical protein